MRAHPRVLSKSLGAQKDLEMDCQNPSMDYKFPCNPLPKQFEGAYVDDMEQAFSFPLPTYVKTETCTSKLVLILPTHFCHNQHEY